VIQTAQHTQTSPQPLATRALPAAVAGVLGGCGLEEVRGRLERAACPEAGRLQAAAVPASGQTGISAPDDDT